MENGPFIDDFPINTSIYKGFSMAMLNDQMVSWIIQKWRKWDEIGIAILKKNISHMSFSSQAQQRCAETAATQRSQGRITVKIPELKRTSTGKPNKFGGSKTWFPVKMFP